MKVILLEELKGRGGEGDVVEVATGYAVNYLFPKKIAIGATKGNLKQLELRKHNIAKRESERLDTADKLMAALDGIKIRIAAKVGEEGQLFGSVTAVQIAEALGERFDIDVDRRKIDIHGTIKTAGEHTVVVSIYRELKANIVVDVIDEATFNESNEAVETDVEVELTESDAVEVTEETTSDEPDATGVVDAAETIDAADDTVTDAKEVLEATETVEAAETDKDAE